MKKRIISLLLVFALAFQLSGALAVTEKEWNAQCVNKTIHETMVYANAVDKENAASLPAGTYVLTHEYDVMSNRWKISYLDGESVKEGYVSGTDLTIAVATVVLEDGSIETIPETLKGQPEEIAAFLNDRYSDRIFEAKDGSILATDAVSDSATVEEETVVDTEPAAEEPAAEEVQEQAVETIPTPAEENTVSKVITFSAPTEAPAPASVPAVTAAPVAAQEPAVAAQVDAAPTATPVPTALPADQYEVPENLKNIVLIGTNTCLVNNEGELSSVKTNSVRFSEGAKKNKMVAYARATADGYVQFLAEPNPRSRVIGYLKTGTIVGIVKSGSNYSRVYVDGIVGCVKTNMLASITVDKKPKGKGILTAGGAIDNTVTVNVLSASSKSYIVDALPCGLQVDIWEKKGNFYQIEANGLRVWVNKSNLTEKASMEGMVEQTAWNHVMETPPSLTKTVRNANGLEEVPDNSKSYNMHRDPYN